MKTKYNIRNHITQDKHENKLECNDKYEFVDEHCKVR